VKSTGSKTTQPKKAPSVSETDRLAEADPNTEHEIKTVDLEIRGGDEEEDEGDKL